MAITGGAGFIGRALGERYRALGAEVVAIDVRSDDPDVVVGDTSVPGAWQDAFDGAEVVVHTAALVSNTSGLQRAWEVNVLGTRHVLDAAVRAGVRRVVHLSSVRAFSDVDFPAEVDEHHPVRPDGHEYVDTKIASERAERRLVRGDEPAVLRRPERAIAEALQRDAVRPGRRQRRHQQCQPERRDDHVEA